MYNICCLKIEIESCFRSMPLCSVLGVFGEYLRAVISTMMEKLKEIWSTLFNSRSCLGCCIKPPHVISVDRPSKGQKVQGKHLRKRSSRDDFWSSSACEMENSAFPSQRSISSISTSNQGLDPHSSSSTTNNNSEFVNHGLILWSKTRQEWIGSRTPEKRTAAGEPKLSFDASYETLLGTNKPFPQSIPLSEMVDFLVDVWEQEGLYD
ncbi:uncharacterized protein LOC107788091 isoform X1 [Nicotiana tabacum]|uniref:Uncharacterized protein LOC107788091 isoform X1 n=2 Tax=Nicotiana tabacum TaxID=4097 RepID=A0A1S3ZLU5_TOBAC|nr:PREDICTED: uncharacterized protein LOC107788091 isoform X1 [Nicotiana tabacum]